MAEYVFIRSGKKLYTFFEDGNSVIKIQQYTKKREKK